MCFTSTIWHSHSSICFGFICIGINFGSISMIRIKLYASCRGNFHKKGFCRRIGFFPNVLALLCCSSLNRADLKNISRIFRKICSHFHNRNLVKRIELNFCCGRHKQIASGILFLNFSNSVRIVFHIVPPYSIILLILSRWL